MSALACLAHVEGAIQQAFLTKEFNAYGKYRIRLYNKPKEKFETIVIDGEGVLTLSTSGQGATVRYSLRESIGRNGRKSN